MGVTIAAMTGMLNKVMTIAVTWDRTFKSVTKITVVVIITGVTLTIEIKIALIFLDTSFEILISETKIVVTVVVIGTNLIIVTKTMVTVITISVTEKKLR